MEMEKKIWTIGHSTRTFDDFVALLQHFNIRHLVDIRTFPGSRRYPQFNKETLSAELPALKIEYTHMIELGGRRKPRPDSEHTAWRHPSFRGYADYMDTTEFREAAEVLEDMAEKKPLAYMCSEAMWWKCHRALVSDYLKSRGWKVLHIMAFDKLTEHPYTSPARAVQGKLFY